MDKQSKTSVGTGQHSPVLRVETETFRKIIFNYSVKWFEPNEWIPSRHHFFKRIRIIIDFDVSLVTVKVTKILYDLKNFCRYFDIISRRLFSVICREYSVRTGPWDRLFAEVLK